MSLHASIHIWILVPNSVNQNKPNISAARLLHTIKVSESYNFISTAHLQWSHQINQVLRVHTVFSFKQKFVVDILGSAAISNPEKQTVSQRQVYHLSET